MFKRRLIQFFLVLLFTLSGCSHKDPSGDTIKVVLAEQFGIAYAPVEVMKAKGYLEEALKEAGFKDVTVEWKKMGNTSAIREAMVAGELDIGFVAIPPFLIGKDNGMDWRIVSGVSESPLALISGDESIKGIQALNKNHKIILPQPGSIQHILLSMHSLNVLGDSAAFDKQLIGLAHPDGMTALLSGGKEQLQFTAPPYLQMILEDERFHTVVDGETCFGGRFTFIVGVCPERVYKNERLYSALDQALSLAINDMNESPEMVIEILSDSYEYSHEALSAYLAHPQMRFTKDVLGLEQFVAFMVNQGIIKTAFATEALIWNAYEE